MNRRIIRGFLFLKGIGFLICHARHIRLNGRIFRDGRIKVQFGKKSLIAVNGSVDFGFNSNGNNGRTSLLRLGNHSILTLTGSTRLFFDSDIQLFDGAKLHIGNSYINSGCKLRIATDSFIGDGCGIATDFTMLDSNFHPINGSVFSAPIRIEDHVWIGTRVTILPGVTIGEGAVVAAGSIVASDVPPNTMVAGNPAVIIKKNVQWSI